MNVIVNNFKFKDLVKFNPSKVIMIIVHHRGGNGDVNSIHQQHLRQGWSGIGYHYYIRKDGQVYQGRPVHYVGSHCKGNNSCAIGICFEGNFKKEKPTAEQIKSGKELVKHIKKMHPKIYKVMNHRDLYPTECPCMDLAKEVR